MHARIAALIAFLFGAISLVSVSGPAHAMDMNCSDFDTQAQAQSYFENNGGSPSNNVDGLDADGDGVVCESNPCPCSDGGGGGGGSGGGTQPKPYHKMTAHKGQDDGHPVAFGKVTTYKGERIRLLRRVGDGTFTFYKTTHTKLATGKYKTVIKQSGDDRTCFRVVAPATNRYRLTARPIGCIG